MALVVLIAALMIFVPFAASTSSAEPSSADDGVSEAATEYAAYNVTKDTYYEYPYAALTEAADGDTVRLLRDVTGLQTISVTGGKAITIDLNGHSISFAFQKYFYVENGSLTLTGEGTVSEQNNFYWYAPVMIQGSTDPNAEVGYSEVVIESSVVLKGWAGIFIDNSDAVSGCAYGVKVDFDGTIISGRDTANDAGHGIYVNGSINKVAENAPVIEVSGDITSEGDGIYAAGYSHWSITDGTIKAPLGMEIRAGTLEISGGSIESTGEFVDPGPNGNGTSAGSGVALSIAQHTTKKPIEVSITGGTLIGPYAVYQANPQDNDAEALAEIKISVTGGTFVSDGEESKGVAGIYSENFTGAVYFVMDEGSAKAVIIVDDVDHPSGSTPAPSGRYKAVLYQQGTNLGLQVKTAYTSVAPVTVAFDYTVTAVNTISGDRTEIATGSSALDTEESAGSGVWLKNIDLGVTYPTANGFMRYEVVVEIDDQTVNYSVIF